MSDSNGKNVFPRTFYMNAIAAASWALCGMAVFFQKLFEQPASVLFGILLTYLFVTGIPGGTALALSRKGTQRLAKGMIWANFALILLTALSIGSTMFFAPPRFLFLFIFGSLFFITPAAINIRALRIQIKCFAVRLETRTEPSML